MWGPSFMLHRKSQTESVPRPHKQRDYDMQQDRPKTWLEFLPCPKSEPSVKCPVKWVNQFPFLLKLFWAEWLLFETEGSEIYTIAESAIKYQIPKETYLYHSGASCGIHLILFLVYFWSSVEEEVNGWMGKHHTSLSGRTVFFHIMLVSPSVLFQVSPKPRFLTS